jgi:hypothetical protein
MLEDTLRTSEEDYICHQAEFPFDKLLLDLKQISIGALKSESHMLVMSGQDGKENFILPDSRQT